MAHLHCRYKSNDYYLKQLIEEWCEGVIQDKNQNQDKHVSYKRTDLGRPHSLLLERVAVHLQNSIAESVAIDLQGLTKVQLTSACDLLKHCFCPVRHWFQVVILVMVPLYRLRLRSWF